MIFGVSVSVLAVVLFYLLGKAVRAVFSYYRTCKMVKNVPGRPTHWLYGNLLQKSEEAYDVKLYEWAKENKVSVSKEWLGPLIVVINIHDPDLMKSLVKTPKADLLYSLFIPWLGRGLLISSGKRWARNRRLLTGAFHFDILKPYIETYNNATDELIANWMSHAHNTPSAPLAAYKSISHLTLDILLRCSFSYESNCQREGSNSPYINAVFDLSRLVVDRFLNLFHLLLNNSLYLYCTANGCRFKKACDIVHKHAENVIQERRKVLGLAASSNTRIITDDVFIRAKKNHKHLDFLDILLTARDDKGEGLSDLDIRYEVDTFMFEGFDTTAHGLCWSLYCLAKYPDHQDKCRDEVNEVLKDRQYVEFDDLAKLSYMHCCIKEAFRLYPPVYLVTRQFDEDTQVEKFTIPKGTLLTFQFFNVHRSPKHWENPEEYNPLRFSSNETNNQNPFAYVPFSAGSRNCIGQNFAMNEERVVLARIIRQFRVTLAEGYEVDKQFGILLHMRNDIQLMIEPL